METIKILKGEAKSKRGVNRKSNVPIDLSVNEKRLPTEYLTGVIDEYEQYLKEKDGCNKYNFIFSVNVVASNILFNKLSEIVYKEGSDECLYFGTEGCRTSNFKDHEGKNRIEKYLKYKGLDTQNFSLNRYELIKDTSYSHKEIGPLVYHCGYDIFSNHILRKRFFSVVNKINDDNHDKNGFNTLSDYNRNFIGNNVLTKGAKIEQKLTGREYDIKQVFIDDMPSHLYMYEDLNSIPMTISDRLVENNGWFGFINRTGMFIKNYGDVSLNKCMNNNKPCEQIDMYPDRELFSFSPKYNKYRRRAEKNWEYCITYPYKNYYDNNIVKNKKTGVKGLVCTIVTFPNVLFSSQFKLNEGVTMLLRTDIHNNIKPGDVVNINITISKDGHTVIRNIMSVNVISTGVGGKYKDYFFTVMTDDFVGVLSPLFWTCKDLNVEYRVVRTENGNECDYYVRLFRKIPNFNGTNVYDDSIITEKEIEEHIDSDFTTSVNNLAFSKNIYGDSIGQVVYSDDVVVSGLRDNLGRELSEVYFTLIKNNKGYKKWYNEKKYSDKDIEFSHCFGKVTAGFDMPMYCDDYNAHKIHNVDIDNYIKNIEDGRNEMNLFTYITPFTKSPKNLEENNEDSEITIDGDTFFDDKYVFFGDIVEFSVSSIKETVLEDVCYRFNTAQREHIYDKEFHDFVYEDIITDDFNLFDIKTKKYTDPIERDENDRQGSNGFTVGKVVYNTFTSDEIGAINKEGGEVYSNTYPFNISPEGYYYKPHNRIVLREYKDKIKYGYNTQISYSRWEETSDGIYELTAIKRYYLLKGDKILMYANDDRNNRVEATVIEDQITDPFKIRIKAEPKLKLNYYVIWKEYKYKPVGAIELGDGRYAYRDIKNDSEFKKDDELYDRTFTNGKIYIQDNINLYLRRQDPFGDNGVNFAVEGYPSLITNLSINGEYKDVSELETINENDSTVICGINLNEFAENTLERLKNIANDSFLSDQLGLMVEATDSILGFFDSDVWTDGFDDFFDSWGDFWEDIDNDIDKYLSE